MVIMRLLAGHIYIILFSSPSSLYNKQLSVDVDIKILNDYYRGSEFSWTPVAGATTEQLHETKVANM